MPDYKESPVAGKQWLRASKVVIDNPLGGVPAVMFLEQKAVQLGDSVMVNDVANLYATFDPQGAFPVINPETGEPTGDVVSHTELYVMLHSLYMHLAKARDDASAPAPQ